MDIAFQKWDLIVKHETRKTDRIVGKMFRTREMGNLESTLRGTQFLARREDATNFMDKLASFEEKL